MIKMIIINLTLAGANGNTRRKGRTPTSNTKQKHLHWIFVKCNKRKIANDKTKNRILLVLRHKWEKVWYSKTTKNKHSNCSTEALSFYFTIFLSCSFQTDGVSIHFHTFIAGSMFICLFRYSFPIIISSKWQGWKLVVQSLWQSFQESQSESCSVQIVTRKSLTTINAIERTFRATKLWDILFHHFCYCGGKQV